MEPVRLEDSIASLKLTSEPPGARIYINGEARGVTPSQIDGICSGKVRVEVKHAAGKFIKDLVLAKDEALSLDCPIRPTLAFLGVEAETSAGDRYREEAAEKIFENLRLPAHVGQLHRGPGRGGEPRPRAGGGRPARRSSPGPGASPTWSAGSATGWPPPSRSRASSWRSCPRSACSAPRGSTSWRRGTPPPSGIDVVFGESASYLQAIEQLDRRFTSQRTWSGLITVDTLLGEGVPLAAGGGREPGGDGRPAARGPGGGHRRTAGPADRRHPGGGAGEEARGSPRRCRCRGREASAPRSSSWGRRCGRSRSSTRTSTTTGR